MEYGHAERNLATVRQLEAETRQLLLTLDRSDPALSAALHEFTNRNLTTNRMSLLGGHNQREEPPWTRCEMPAEAMAG
jgi:hypothetical protein